MRTSNLSESFIGSSGMRIQPKRLDAPNWKFDVPVLQETLLMVELEAQEFCVDLHAISQLVLNDLGATLQILRLVGREYVDAGNRPVRIEDCVAAMGVQACIEGISSEPVRMKRSLQAMSELSRHSREIALHCRRIAEQTVDVDLDQAYFVGLCHSIGSLPSVLGWNGNRSAEKDSVSPSLKMAKEWCLPGCVIDYFYDRQDGRCLSPWQEMVRTAHQGACAVDGECVLGAQFNPQLLWAV